jgi:DNA polymerase III subunit delta
MLLKGKPAAGFAKRPDPAIWAVLIFGDDDGLISDAARDLLAAWAADRGDLEIAQLDEDAVRKDPALLFDTLEAMSLLGDPRAVRLRTSGDKIAGLIADALVAGDRAPKRFAARLVIEAGNLAAKSKLRSAAETAKRSAALQLFADRSDDIQAAVQMRLREAGIAITPDALIAFVGDLPGNRALANSEIEKLSLFAHGLGRPIALDDVRAVSATEVAHELAPALRLTLSGDIAAANGWLDRLEAAGTSGISLLRSLQFETLRLLDAHARIAAGDDHPNMKLRPPVWQNDWPAYRQLLSKWPPKRLFRILDRIYAAESDAKKSSASAPVIVRMLLQDLAKAAEKPG